MTATLLSRPLALRLGLLLLAAATSFAFWGASYDDNFITYRYASNWMHGEGLVFNPGERVFGTSAPGYAVLLGSLAASSRPIGVAIEHWGTLISVTSLLALGWLFELAPRAGRKSWLPAVVVFTTVTLLLPLNVRLLGSEAFPVAALVAAAAVLLFRRSQPLAAGLAVAAAMALRLDAGLAALVFGLVEWGRRRRFPFTYAAGGLLPLAGWLLFLWSSFGQLVPLTLGGKSALRAVPYSLREWQMFSTTLPGLGWIALLGGALLGLGWTLANREVRTDPLFLAIGLWLVTHELAYRWLHVWFAPWYHVALTQAIVALFAVGCWSLARRLRDSWTVLVALLVLVSPLLVPSVRYVLQQRGRPTDPRHAIYAAAGDWVRQHTAPESTVLAFEIGVLGYVAERRILDLGGLVSPRFTAAKFTGTRPELAAQLAPDYIVDLTQNAMLQDVLDQPGVRDRYEEVASFTGPDFPQGEVRILARRW